METSCIRLRFTPLFKNIRKSDSKCCLEITPEVSYIQNLDKIQWQQGDNSIEYTIPITYKVTLKKKKEAISNVQPIKTYHSCVDLLIQSSLNDINVDYRDITKKLSEPMILNKETDNNRNDATRETLNLKEVQTIELNPTGTSTLPITNGKQFEKDKIYVIDKVTSTSLSSDFCNQHTSADLLSYTGTVDYVSSTGGKAGRKLSVSPVCSIDTNDDPVDLMKDKTSNLLVMRIQKPHYNITFCDRKHNKLTVPKEKYGFDVIKQIEENSFETRVLPEVRVKQFMKNIERELSPLRNKLNDMILKCSLLGYICKHTQNSLYKSVSQSKKGMYCKESNSNRVVYSIVFDG